MRIVVPKVDLRDQMPGSDSIKDGDGITILLFRASRKTIKSVCSNQGRDRKFVTGLLAACLRVWGQVMRRC
jgi:hypothetical protein